MRRNTYLHATGGYSTFDCLWNKESDRTMATAANNLQTPQQQEAHTAPTPIEKPLTAEEVAEIMSCSVDHVQTLARKKKLPGFQLGKLWRFRPSVVRAWMEEQEKLNSK